MMGNPEIEVLAESVSLNGLSQHRMQDQVLASARNAESDRYSSHVQQQESISSSVHRRELRIKMTHHIKHGPSIKEWCRDGHWFVNDLDHRNDVMTCGVLSKELVMETRGIGLNFVLLVWPREGTWRVQKSVLTQLVL